jgi:VWFA-related protein
MNAQGVSEAPLAREGRMFIDAPRVFILLALMLPLAASAQQPASPALPGAGRIVLDVVVTPKSGPPVRGLQQQDFTLLDNNVPQPITSFQAVNGRQAPIEIVLLVDAVNTDYHHLAYARQEIDRFLHAEGGNLAYPTTLDVLTDTSAQTQGEFLNDGNKLSAWLDQATISLRNLNRSSGFYGAAERLQISLNGLQQLLAREATHSGRKIILWVSPGWPLLANPGLQLDEKQEQRLFSEIVGFSTDFLQAGVTLYSIDPLGTADAGGFRTFYWKEYLKGVTKPSQAQPADLALQVLATQSGGLALSSSNDVASLVEECVADVGNYYEISFDPRPDDRPNEYHRLEVRAAKHGLIARTRQGYYAHPTM